MAVIVRTDLFFILFYAALILGFEFFKKIFPLETAGSPIEKTIVWSMASTGLMETTPMVTTVVVVPLAGFTTLLKNNHEPKKW